MRLGCLVALAGSFAVLACVWTTRIHLVPATLVVVPPLAVAEWKTRRHRIMRMTDGG